MSTPGTVVTFYSYKGGVGRTFALANIAVLLGRWGFRVLCIDWDLEAPGLSHFFSETEDESDQAKHTPAYAHSLGLVDLLTEFRIRKQVPLLWRGYVREEASSRTPGVSLMTAGRSNGSYSKRLAQLNWSSLYRNGLGNALETMFEELRAEYDFVFVDSRTGVTDFSGIVTAQLPDILVFLFTANWQSLLGSLDVVRRAVAARNDLAVDRARLQLLPIPARFEVQLEHTISTIWRRRYVDELSSFYESWAAKDSDISRLVQATTIPYVPFWSFGERLAVVDEKINDSLSINYSLETIAALLAHRLGNTRLLMDSRDDFVSAASRLQKSERHSRYTFYIGHSEDASGDAITLSDALNVRGFTCFRESTQRLLDSKEREASVRSIERCEHMIVILDPRPTAAREQETLARAFLRQAASDSVSRLLIPVVARDVDEKSIPGYLRHYRRLNLSDGLSKVASAIAAMVSLGESTESASPGGTSTLVLRVLSDTGMPLAGASVTAQSANGTTVDAVTEANGSCHLGLLDGRAYTLLIAHPRFAACVLREFNASQQVQVALSPGGGSVIIHTSGRIPNLAGRVSPVLDTSGRLYLYADNIAINGGERQPVTFRLGEPFRLEDNVGSVFDVTIVHIFGRTALLQFVQASGVRP